MHNCKSQCQVSNNSKQRQGQGDNGTIHQTDSSSSFAISQAEEGPIGIEVVTLQIFAVCHEDAQRAQAETATRWGAFDTNNNLALEPNCQNTGVKEGTNHDQSIDMDLKPGFKKKKLFIPRLWGHFGRFSVVNNSESVTEWAWVGEGDWIRSKMWTDSEFM